MRGLSAAASKVEGVRVNPLQALNQVVQADARPGCDEHGHVPRQYRPLLNACASLAVSRSSPPAPIGSDLQLVPGLSIWGDRAALDQVLDELGLTDIATVPGALDEAARARIERLDSANHGG